MNKLSIVFVCFPSCRVFPSPVILQAVSTVSLKIVCHWIILSFCKKIRYAVEFQQDLCDLIV